MVKLALLALSLFVLPFVVAGAFALAGHSTDYSWLAATLTGLGMAVVGVASRLIGERLRHS